MSNCEPVHKIVGDIWKKWGPVITEVGIAVGTAAGQPAAMAALVVAAGKVAEVSKQMVRFWNDNVGNTWAKIGPRHLVFGEKLEGQLVSIGDRWFVTSAPSTHDELQFDLWEKDGKGKTEVTVHLIDPRTGACRDDGHYTFNDTNDEKKNQSQHVQRKISNALGQVIAVQLNGQGLTNTFQYELKVTGL